MVVNIIRVLFVVH